MQVYGLIGEKLTHSFSKAIHEKLGDTPYSLIPLMKSELDGFLRNREFKGINVTIPYKRDVMPYCDVLDERAKAIGAVNTIVNRDGQLYGYNTDFDGFLYTLQKNHIDVCGKTVLVLGNGGVCQPVKAVLKQQNAREILVVSRSDSSDTISYAEAETRKDVDIVINATPVGMYPNVGNCPIDLTCFPKLCAVVDLIYNPLKTTLLLQAEELHIPFANGLLMLVAQAKVAAELFLDSKIPDSQIDKIYGELYQEESNLVLIGMPMSGKTTVGRLAAKLLHKEFVDLDVEITKKAGMSIPEVFERFSEAGFREIERDVVKEVSLRNGIIISTGGGTPIFPENMRNLRQNGMIAFLDRPLEQLSVGRGRPLAKSPAEIAALYAERYPIYSAVSDFSVPNEHDAISAAQILIQKYLHAVDCYSDGKKE